MMKEYYRKMRGDRPDGWRVRDASLFFRVIPYIMKTRLDSQNYYAEDLDVEPIMTFLKDHRETLPNVTMMTVFLAAIVRLLSQRPQINRFVVHSKIYAHNSIEISMAIKRSLSDDGEETMIKPSFDPKDTLMDVQRRLDAAIEEALPEAAEQTSGIDAVAGRLSHLPDWMFRFVSWFLFRLDDHGKLPKMLIRVSPWHCSTMFTNVGSLGIGPIYHHLTQLGTYSSFFAIGRRERHTVYDADGVPRVRRTIGLKVVNDERICDGYYYAASMWYFRRLLMNPEMLLDPPEEVMLDPGVTNPLIRDPNRRPDAGEQSGGGTVRSPADA